MGEKENAGVDILELLLAAKPRLPEKELVMTRLSEELGTDVTFRIRALSYNTVAEHVRGKEDSELRIVMEGLVSPNLKDARLLEKFHAVTPLELLKNPQFLQPGEVDCLSNEIARLSGYRSGTFRETVKN